MIRTLIAATAATFLLVAPALARHCPKDAAAIDAALAKMSVSAELKAQVMALRDKGMEAHAAGNHADSEALLAEAMRMLLMAV